MIPDSRGKLMTSPTYIPIFLGSFWRNYTTQGPDIAAYVLTFLQGLNTDDDFNLLMQQYNVPGKTIKPGKIGKAAFVKSWQPTPLDDNGLRYTLKGLQSQRTVPNDTNGNNMYILFFPPDSSIKSGGEQSCVDNGFCARHSSLSLGSNRFVIMPYLKDGACDGRCGASNIFDAYTINLSHEIAETITNPDINFATSLSSPLSWYDPDNYAEVGDVCSNTKNDEITVSIAGIVEQSFATQKLWSNHACMCV